MGETFSLGLGEWWSSPCDGEMITHEVVTHVDSMRL
jgi:hypothetical protein